MRNKKEKSRKLMAFFLCILMIIGCVAGNHVYAISEYPDFDITFESTKNSGGSGISPGDTMKTVITFTRKDENISAPYNCEVLINKELLKDVNSPPALTSEFVEGTSIPIFKISAAEDYTDPQDGLTYFKYVMAFNEDASEVADSILTAKTELLIRLSESSSVVEIEHPIIVEIEGGEITHKPVITPPAVDPILDYELDKYATHQFRINSSGQYERIASTDNWIPVQVGDVFEFKIDLRNTGTLPITVKAEEVIEQLYKGFQVLNSSDPNYLALKSDVNAVEAGRIQSNYCFWTFKQSADDYNEYYSSSGDRALSQGKKISYYIYAEVADKTDDGHYYTKLNNRVNYGTKSDAEQIRTPSSTSGVYDMAITTYFRELYTNGKNTQGVEVTSMSTAKKPFMVMELDSFKEQVSYPYVKAGDILRLRTIYYNQGTEVVKNLKIAIYLPNHLFDMVQPAEYSIKGAEALKFGSNYPLSPTAEQLKTNRYSGITAWYDNIDIYELTTTGQVPANESGYVDVLVRVKDGFYDLPDDYFNETNPIHAIRYSVAAELSEIRGMDGSLVVDKDSINDSNPFNDLFPRSADNFNLYIGTKIKEKDNKTNQNVLEKTTEKEYRNDEDDFDFAPALKILQKENYDVNKDINITYGKSIYAALKKSGGYKFIPEYTSITNSYEISDPYTYVPYTITINGGGYDKLTNVVVTDKLPNGLVLLKDVTGKPAYSVQILEGKGQYYDTNFPDNSLYYNTANYYPFTPPVWRTGIDERKTTGTMEVVYDENTNIFTLSATELDHVQLNITLLIVLSSDQNKSETFKNTAILAADSIEEKVVTSKEVTWETSSAASFVKKYMYVPSINDWVRDENIYIEQNTEDSFDVRYQIKINAQSSGSIFELNELSVVDNVGARATNISDVKLSGLSEGTVLTEEDVKKLFSYQILDNNRLVISNTEGVVPAVNADYIFEFTVTYGALKPGQAVYNVLYGKKLFNVKPLDIEVLKTDSKGTSLGGAVFKLYYKDDDSAVKDINNQPIEIRPGTGQNRIKFIPRNYLTEDAWKLLLKEVTAPQGYTPKDYEFELIKSSNGDLVLKPVEDSYIKIEEGGSTITLINYKPGEPIPPVTPPKPVDPTDPAGPSTPTDPTTPPDTGGGTKEPPTDTKPPTGGNGSTDPADPNYELPDLPFPLGPVQPTEPTKPGDILNNLEDENTPLGGIQVGNDLAVGIEDDDVPLGGIDGDGYDDVPKTGDSMMLFTAVLLLLLVSSATFIRGVSQQRKGKKYKLK